MDSLRASSPLQNNGKLNPNAEPFVYLQKSIPPNLDTSLFPYYPSQICCSLVRFEPSIFRNYWCCLPYPSPRLPNSIPAFTASTNTTFTSNFDGQKAIQIQPKLTVTQKGGKEPWNTKTQVLCRRFRCRFEARKAPIPKPKLQLKDASSSLDFSDLEVECGRTTVMIKNIPGRFTRSILLELLDNHCVLENEKASSPPSEYDFVYLPIDFRQKLNLGYAFVNFTTPLAAKTLYKSMNDFKWDSFGSKKVCKITYATVQGKDALVRHFKNKKFRCVSEMFLPVLLSPPRNGSTSRPFPSLLGKLTAPLEKSKGRELRFCSRSP